MEIYVCLPEPENLLGGRGFIILSVFIILGLVLLAKSILPLNGSTQIPSMADPETIALLFAFATAIYTGILLKATKSVPLWNTSLLPILFLVSALSTGSMAIILSTLGTGFFAHDAER